MAATAPSRHSVRMRWLMMVSGILIFGGCAQVEAYRFGGTLLPRIDRNAVRALTALPEGCQPVAQLYFETRSAAVAQHMFETRAATLGADVIVLGETAVEAERAVPASVREAVPSETRHTAVALRCTP